LQFFSPNRSWEYFVVRILICITVACSLAIFATVVIAQDNKLSVDKDHMVGVIEAHMANVESWRSGDFLLRIRDDGTGRYCRPDAGPGESLYVEGPDAMSLISRGDRLHRVVFDFDQQRLLIINRMEIELQVFDALDEDVGEAEKRNDDRVVLLDMTKGIGLSRLKPAIVHRIEGGRMRSPEQFFASWGIPEIRLLGCSALASAPWSDTHFRLPLDQLRNLDSIEEILHVGDDRYQVFSRHDVNPENRRSGFRTYIDWDVQRHVPRKFAIYNGYSLEDLPGATKPQWTSTADWKLIDGNCVPVSARHSRTMIRSVYGRYFRISEETTIDLHWFSINSELSDDLFDEKILHDRKKLDELLSEEVFDKNSNSD